MNLTGFTEADTTEINSFDMFRIRLMRAPLLPMLLHVKTDTFLVKQTQTEMKMFSKIC